MRGFAAAAVVLGSALVGSPAGAEHLLDRATLDKVLSDRAEQRRTDLAKLDAFLSTSAAERAVESMSADPLRMCAPACLPSRTESCTGPGHEPPGPGARGCAAMKALVWVGPKRVEIQQIPESRVREGATPAKSPRPRRPTQGCGRECL